MKTVLLAVGLVTVLAGQGADSIGFDKRLSIHTIVREDAFAGFLANDMERSARSEKNIELLLVERPSARAELLSWKGGNKLFAAVIAHEQKRPEEFQHLYQMSLDLFAEAARLAPANSGVSAVTGGSYVLFADRLPQPQREAGWATAYNAYRTIWKEQEPILEKLSSHARGELLGGLAQSAQRTGRADEVNQYLDKILAVLPGTP